MSLSLSEQLAQRQQGKAPSQLNRQRIPIYGDKATATSETRPLTWRLAHHDAVLDLATYQSLKGFDGLKIALQKSPKEVGAMIKEANVRGRGRAGLFLRGYAGHGRWQGCRAGHPAGLPRARACGGPL